MYVLVSCCPNLLVCFEATEKGEKAGEEKEKSEETHVLTETPEKKEKAEVSDIKKGDFLKRSVSSFTSLLSLTAESWVYCCQYRKVVITLVRSSFSIQILYAELATECSLTLGQKILLCEYSTNYKQQIGSKSL